MPDLRSLLSSFTPWAQPRAEEAAMPQSEQAREQARKARLEAIRTYGNRMKTRELIALAMPREVFRMLTSVDVLQSTLTYYTRQNFTAPELGNQPQQLTTQLSGNELFLTHYQQAGPTGAFAMVRQLQGVIEGQYTRVAIVSGPDDATQCRYQRVMPYHMAQFAELRDLALRYGTPALSPP